MRVKRWALFDASLDAQRRQRASVRATSTAAAPVCGTLGAAAHLTGAVRAVDERNDTAVDRFGARAQAGPLLPVRDGRCARKPTVPDHVSHCRCRARPGRGCAPLVAPRADLVARGRRRSRSFPPRAQLTVRASARFRSARAGRMPAWEQLANGALGAAVFAMRLPARRALALVDARCGRPSSRARSKSNVRGALAASNPHT